MVGNETVYEGTVKVAEDYFGPAAPRLLSRVITYHLHKEPNDLNYGDVTELIRWLQLALAVITEDQTVIDEFIARLRKFSTRR